MEFQAQIIPAPRMLGLPKPAIASTADTSNARLCAADDRFVAMTCCILGSGNITQMIHEQRNFPRIC